MQTKIPHRKSTQVALICFALVFAGVAGWAWVELKSVISLFVFVIGIAVLFSIARVSVHVEVTPDHLICYQVFTERVVDLSTLEKIVVDSSDEGTVTFHFSTTKIRMAQAGKSTRSVVEQVLSQCESVEFSDRGDWNSTSV